MEDNFDYQYMVDFTLPEILTEEFMSVIPYQRAAVNRLFLENRLVTYALSLEKSKLWAIFNAESEIEVMDMIADMPLTPYLSVDISILTFHNTTEPEMPFFSMN